MADPRFCWIEPRPSNFGHATASMEEMDATHVVKTQAVSVERVAKQVTELFQGHKSNLVAFTRQKIRCVKCNASYRRILIGTCIIKKENYFNTTPRELINIDSRPFAAEFLTLTVSPGARSISR